MLAAKFDSVFFLFPLKIYFKKEHNVGGMIREVEVDLGGDRGMGQIRSK